MEIPQNAKIAFQGRRRKREALTTHLSLKNRRAIAKKCHMRWARHRFKKVGMNSANILGTG